MVAPEGINVYLEKTMRVPLIFSKLAAGEDRPAKPVSG
jgi:hypothetical protein